MTTAARFNSYELDPLASFGVGFDELPIMISDGMGVESATIIAKLADNPELLPGFSWERAVVVTAQTGGEYESTRQLRQKYILPILRDLGVRTVQVARAGAKEEDGVVVLDDTREPYTVYIEGAYTLEQELRASGVVPAFGGEHVCSMKSKAAPLDTWRAHEFGETAYRHIFGYSAGEQGRIDSSNGAVIKRNNKALKEGRLRPHRLFIGYSAGEQPRIIKARKYRSCYCIPEYPLDYFGMDRGDCIEYLLDRFGVVWRKSACRFCVFCAVGRESLDRWREEARGAGESMFTEYIALCINPRSTLFRKGSMFSFIEADGNEEALAHFYHKLDTTTWGLYEVRRLYHAKGKAARAVEKLAHGTREEMDREWEQRAAGLTLREEHGIGYAYVQEREEGTYPAFEHFFVVAPDEVETKTRYGFDNFDAKWASLNPALGRSQGELFSAAA